MNLQDIFKGKWQLTWSKDNVVNSEYVEIRNDEYYANGALAFYLIPLIINDFDIVFQKVRLTGQYHTIEVLEYIEDRLIGVDSKGYNLIYEKV